MVTLTGGLGVQFRGEDQVDGEGSGARRSAVDLRLGVGYSWSEYLTWIVDVRSNISGNDGAELGLTTVYNLGKIF